MQHISQTNPRTAFSVALAFMAGDMAKRAAALAAVKREFVAA